MLLKYTLRSGSVRLLCFIHLTFGYMPASSAAFFNQTARQQYIRQWSNEAVYQMVLNRIPASITLAQGILESGDGNSRLATEGNNHFGIKCHSDWTGKTIAEDDETKGECFRKYDNARQSYEDHSAFLKRKRYEPLFELKTDDYKGWAYGLKQCGYATNPRYPELLIGIIEDFKLYEYDRQGMEYIARGELPERSADGIALPVASTTPKAQTKSNKNRGTHAESRPEITISKQREIALSENRIKYTTAKEGETLESIAKELEMNVRQLQRYNDLEPGSKLTAGQVLYIQPKRNKAKAATHEVQHGDTWWSISQKHGIKLRRLKKLNQSQGNESLKRGDKLRLRN